MQDHSETICKGSYLKGNLRIHDVLAGGEKMGNKRRLGKFLFLILVGVLVVGCQAKVEQLPSQQQAANKSNNLEKEIIELKGQMNDLQKQLDEITVISGVGIKNILLQNTKKTAKGKLYGEFDAVVTVKNNGKKAIPTMKVMASLEKDMLHYEKREPEMVTQVQAYHDLKPGQEVNFNFPGFMIGHPEEVHYLIVDLSVSNGAGDTRDDIKKIKLDVSFPPGSED